MKFFLAFVVFFAFIFAFNPSTTKAEDITKTITLFPAIINTKVDPGEKQAKNIAVVNHGVESLALKTYAMNFRPADMFGSMSFDRADDKSFSGADWIKYGNQAGLVLAPGEKKNFSFSVEVPQNAEPGGHYVSLFFEPTVPVQYEDKSKIGITGRVGALLFITVNGDIEEAGQVLGATTDKECQGVSCSFKAPKFSEYGPIPFTFVFYNSGNVHTKVKGKIEIFNIFKQKIAEIPVDEKTVLPDSERRFDTKWMRELLFGRYRARLTITYGSSITTESASVVFWSFPYKIVIYLVVMILCTFFIAKMVKRIKRKKPISKKIE